MISWREYVDNLTEEGDIKNILQSAFEEAEYFIGSMSNYYGLQISIPNIFICSSTKINASVFDKKIIINEGLLGLLFFEDLKIDNNYLDDKKQIPKRTLLWIVAHEYFHYARHHIEIRDKYGKEYEHALEDDADCLATAALYRHISTLVNIQSKRPTDVKIAVLTFLFYPIRLLVGSSIRPSSDNEAHAVWPARLLSAIIKLSEIDNCNNVPGSGRVTYKTLNVQHELEKELDMLETNYLKTNQCASEGSNLFKYKEQYAFSDLNAMNEQWKKFDLRFIRYALYQI